MRAKTNLVGLVATALLLVSAAGCGSSDSSDSSSSAKPDTSSTTTAPDAASPNLKACAMVGYVASGGATDGATWMKVVQSAEKLKAGNEVIDPLRTVADRYAAKDKAGALKALEQFNAVCKPYG